MILPDPCILKQAAADFRYLLDRDYPQEPCLTLVGNRYHLDKNARQLLHRGVFAREVAEARKAKLRQLIDLAGRPLAVDGHNVLITLESALRGLPLVAADDGFIRDVAQASRAYREQAETVAALGLMARHLKDSRAGPVTLLFDAPMSKSGMVSAAWNADYHHLLMEFRRRTGRGAVLNTSFNLHGFPIANTPEDALDVLKNSGLQHLLLGHHLVHKRERNGAASA